jgi:uncharacterized membrane protein YjjP (DUF1212 family)
MLSALAPLLAIFGFSIARLLFLFRQHAGKDLALKTKLAIEFTISIAVLALGLFVASHDPQNKHLAWAAGGVAVGYWLHK